MYILTLDHPHSASSSLPDQLWPQDLSTSNIKRMVSGYNRLYKFKTKT